MVLQSQRSFCTLLVVIALLWQQASQAEPNEQRAFELNERAHALLEKDQYQPALDLLKQSLQIKEDPWVYRNIGACYSGLNNNAEARKYFEHSFLMKPDDADNRSWLAYCLIELKDFKGVINLCDPFLSNHITDKECTRLWYQYAHALAQQRRYGESYTAWDHYFDLSPSNPNDWWQACADFSDPAAAKYLYPLHQEFAKRFPKHQGVRAMSRQVRTAVQTARSAASASKTDKFENLITYKDPKQPNVVSRTFYGVVKEGLRAIPEHVWKPLIDYGCKVMLTPYVTDVDPANQNEHPRGYKIGSTFRNVAGCYIGDKKWITVAEYHLDDQKKPRKNDDPAATVCHELGHAYDRYLGDCSRIYQAEEVYTDFSHSKSFTEAYLKDAASLAPEAKKNLGYFLQADNKAGQEELFAELFPILFDESAMPGSNDELLRRGFPTTLKLMASVLHVHWDKK